MKPISLILVLCCCIMLSCNNNKQNSISEKQDQYEEAFNQSEKLKEEASKNPEFAKSKEYSKQMERAAIEMAKNTHGLNQSDKLLLEFELALKSLKQNTELLKQNPKLTKDLSFLEKTQAKADKVREYQQMIKKINLNPTEKKKFDELCQQ